MSQDPNYSRTVSLKLSEVLSDIGVTERMVQKRRRMTLLIESMLTTTNRLMGNNMSAYMFGSQSEGTTTLGLNSDIDTLCCHFDINVMQDWSEWQPGMFNLLMIQNEITSPGYCLLQCLCSEKPLPLLLPIPDDMVPYLAVRGGKVLLNNLKSSIAPVRENTVINGPALSTEGYRAICDRDYVDAFSCKSWPVEAQNWLTTGSVGGWPTEKMKRYCETTGCFVVQVSSKSGRYEDVEWRISTSKAERCLMFSLNITQIRCYILMKMILKTFINPKCDGVLSSFMCKNVLFHCIQNTSPAEWQEHNLLACLNCCLLELQTCVRHGSCPHFIINGNNLMAGKISSSNKNKLLEILQLIIQSEGRKLLEIPIDSLGMRLKRKMNMFPDKVITSYKHRDQLHGELSSRLLINLVSHLTSIQTIFFANLMCDENEIVQQKLVDSISTVGRTYREININSSEKSTCNLLKPMLCSQKSTCELLKPMLCSLLGSVIASNDINTNNTLSRAALDLLSAGSNSDVSSGRLKHASALYCAGDIPRTETFLRDTEDLYDFNTVEPICSCDETSRSHLRSGFCDKSNTDNEEIIKQVTALCVRFLLCEINCVPKELKYEMFRSTKEEKLERNALEQDWMDWAVVDSLPYLYFLQYKTYHHLQRTAEQHQALRNLHSSIESEPNLGHRETALNLLGQCMEQENWHMEALRCYTKSLHVRARNNAARIHICRLLNVLVNRQKL